MKDNTIQDWIAFFVNSILEGVIPMKRSANFMDNFTGKPLGFHT